jgi:hypothetical protein
MQFSTFLSVSRNLFSLSKVQLLKESQIEGSRDRERERETREQQDLTQYLRQIDEMERRERELNPEIAERERIIQEQDRAYQDMVERDRQRVFYFFLNFSKQLEMEKKQEELRRKEAEEKLKEETKLKIIEERREKLRLKYKLEPNPEIEENLVKLIFKFEDKRIQRYFRKEETFQVFLYFSEPTRVFSTIWKSMK